MSLDIKKISFVIPCYGSEKTISFVIQDIVETVEDKNDYEIICVNDCSKDNVFKVLKELATRNDKVKVINLAKNSGQHNALMCGFRHVSGDIVVCLDDDGQTNPKDCYKLIDALDENVDLVFARYPNKHHSKFRNFGSYINKKMSEWLCDVPNDIIITSYYACKRFVVDELIRYNNPYTFLAGLFFRTTKNVKNVDIIHKDRISGKSGYSIFRLIGLWMNGFTAFSVKPLRIASFFGFLIAFFGFAFGIYQIIMKIINPTRPIGYSSIMCTILFVGGMIMLMLGLIGEYIGRIYICINNSPQYVIKERINFND